MMQWKKDPKVKYTDLCIYIDENVPKIATSRDYPEIENNIYNYLWLLVKALAIKKRMFQKFEDYDGYAFHAADRLFFALKKNYQNQGKVIKGKLIKPIKSCLNYTKALMYPMKVEYQNKTYKEIISSDVVAKKFDAFSFQEKLKSAALSYQQEPQWSLEYIRETLQKANKLIDKVLEKSPFLPDSIDYKKLKMSILLNCNFDLKNKKAFDFNPGTIYAWKLPKSMSSYIRVLLKEFYNELKIDIMECYSATQVDDSILAKIIANPEGDLQEYEE